MKIHWKANLLVFDYWFFLLLFPHLKLQPDCIDFSRIFAPELAKTRTSPTEIMQWSEWLQSYLWQRGTQIRRKKWLWGKFWDKEPILSSPTGVRSQPNLSCFVCCWVFEVVLLIRDLEWSYKTILLAGKINLVCWCHCGNMQRTKSWRFYSGLRTLRNPWS